MQRSLPTLRSLRPLYLFLFIFSSTASVAQCVSSSANNGTIFTDDANIGIYGFNNVNNAKDADNHGATASSLAVLLSGSTHYLKVTGFNFSIPPYATVCGVSVQVRRWANGLTSLLPVSVTDNEVKLIKNGVLSGNNYAKAGNWTTSQQTTDYGGTTDRWGTTLYPADVNAPDFGIAISANLVALIAALPSAVIDDVKMTVYYYATPLPIVLSQFSTNKDGNGINCTWTLDQQEMNSAVQLERSSDMHGWKTIARYAGFINSRVPTKYSYTDHPDVSGKYYYRLKLILPNGDARYSTINTVSFKRSNTPKLYPTVASQTVYINQAPANIQVCNNMGQIVKVPVKTSQQLTMLTINTLPQGLYFVNTQEGTYRFIKTNQ